MSRVAVPDLGDYADVPVIEVLVAPGDTVAAEAPLIVIESDKATMEIPAPRGGTVDEVLISVGDTVSAGTEIVALAGEENSEQNAPDDTGDVTGDVQAAESAPADARAAPDDGAVDLVVVGSGPGGYTAAFRAADLGLEVVLVER